MHGPPGVGKSFLHHLLAKALYNATMGFGECPGYACPGYKVLFGMDYLADEEAQQAAFLQGQLVQHLRRHPQALVVVEEYDKLDCHARGLVKQLLDKGVGEAGGDPLGEPGGEPAPPASFLPPLFLSAFPRSLAPMKFLTCGWRPEAPRVDPVS